MFSIKALKDMLLSKVQGKRAGSYWHLFPKVDQCYSQDLQKSVQGSRAENMNLHSWVFLCTNVIFTRKNIVENSN